MSAVEEVTATIPLSGPRPTIVSLFVGDLDPSVTEDQLAEHFKTAGAVLNVRVCRDIITRRSLGYGYVNFQNQADAERAMNTLNFSQLGSRAIRVMWQQRDPAQRLSGHGNLFVKNLKPETTHKALTDLFGTFGQIMSAKVITDADGKCRGYGFVQFRDDGVASTALTQMNGRKLDGWDNPLYVATFIRRNARIAMLAQKFTNVYIKHVLPNIDRADIEKFFSKFGGITSAIAKKDAKGRVFAFCNFAVHDDAVKAVAGLNDKEISGLTAQGEKLYVSRAQHRSERLIELRQKYLQRQSRGNNLYVRNFDPTFTEENLRDLFKNYGAIKSCKVMTDEKGNPRGFGFVLFENAEDANTALRELNGRMLNGKPLVVNVAQRRDQRLSMLQMQFQQRLQAMMRPMPMFPFFAPPQPKMLAPAPVARTMKRPAAKPAAPATPAAAPAPAVIPAMPELPALATDAVMAMPEDERKSVLGERLFMRLMQNIPEELTPKVTGMLLDLPAEQVLAMLSDDKLLFTKADEAICVLKSQKAK
jgi:polyadenylate-binding protein